MNLIDVKAAALALRGEIGERCSISIDLKANHWGGEDNDNILRAYCFPLGAGQGAPTIAFYCDSYEEAFDGIRERWAEIRDNTNAEITRKMALAIIQITFECGQCTDAALRGETDFTDAQIKQHGYAAESMANEMAENGPFKIKLTIGANAA